MTGLGNMDALAFPVDGPIGSLIEQHRREHTGRTAAEAWSSPLVRHLLSMLAPPQHGGFGMTVGDVVDAFQACGRNGVDPGLLFAVGAQVWSAHVPLIEFGTPNHRSAWLPDLIAGKIRMAHAATEPTGGSDVLSSSTEAVRMDSGYKVNGVKSSITGALSADLALVLVRTNRRAGPLGFSTLVVDLYAQGVRRGQTGSQLGLQSVDVGTLWFDDCLVGEDRRIGQEGAGLAIFSHAMDHERAFILAPVIGVMERQLREAVAFANERRAGNKHIGAYQSISNRVADMRVRVDIANALMQQTVRRLQLRSSIRAEAAILKLAVSESYLQSSLDLLRIKGAHGFADRDGVGRDVVDSIGSLLYSGTSDIQRNLIATLSGIGNG